MRGTAMIFWLAVALPWTCGSAQTAMPAPELQSITQIEKASPAGSRARFSAVVTGVDAARFFVQDASGAAAVTRSPAVPALTPGDVCEITGKVVSTSKGLEIMPESVIKTSTAALPAGRAMKIADVIAGKARHQRVRLTGFLHEAGMNEGEVILALETDGITVFVIWPAAEQGVNTMKPPLELLDAQVEVEGVAVPQAGNASHMSGTRMLLASSSHLQVKRPGSADVFSRPAKTLRQMRDKKLDNGERYLMKGTVTYWSDAGWFYFTDGTSSARGNSTTYIRNVIGWPYRQAPGRNPPLKPGDEIEVTAARRNVGPSMPHLIHCEWRVTGRSNPPLYVPVTAKDVVEKQLDGDAVSIICRLEETQWINDFQGFINHNLWATSGDRTVQVLVQKKKAQPVSLNPGDYFRAHGTVSFSQASTGPKTAFRLNVNDLADIVPLPPPPAWQNPALMRSLGIASVVLLLAAAWIITLRRQVKAQTLQLQTQLQQEKELSEMKTRFVFTVSHEFRNPLAVILSCSDVLQRLRDKLTPGEHDRQIEGIQQNVRRMADMMEEVLLLGRAEAGRLPCEPQPLDVSAFSQKLADQIRSASNQRCAIELRIPADMPCLMLDPSLLQHILGNLISNAVKYSPQDSSVEVSAAHEGTTAVFTIRDHGPGIPTLDRPLIFEPFQRGSNVGETTGTGLGLAIADRCARTHGGSIECESSTDEGTTFIVRIPSSVAADKTPPP